MTFALHWEIKQSEEEGEHLVYRDKNPDKPAYEGESDFD